jgi:hypothetical protein
MKGCYSISSPLFIDELGFDGSRHGSQKTLNDPDRKRSEYSQSRGEKSSWPESIDFRH